LDYGEADHYEAALEAFRVTLNEEKAAAES
jgi:hypothetical protein